jgi:hypothetical protein
MIKTVAFAGVAALAVGIGFSGTAFAQAGGGSLIVYGNDPCPANTICVRAPESERYRIPQSLRSGNLPASQQPGRAAAVSSVGGVNTGPASCSNIGGGGGSNCLRNQIAASRAEKKAKKTEQAESALPQ